MQFICIVAVYICIKSDSNLNDFQEIAFTLISILKLALMKIKQIEIVFKHSIGDFHFALSRYK